MSGATKKTRSAHPRRFHPQLELLEDRCLPSLSAFLLQSVNNPTPAAGDLFGRPVAALGTDRLLVGAPSANGGVGEVDLFNNVGALIRTFQHPNPGAHTAGLALAFGTSVTAVGTDKVLIGAAGADTGATDAGEAYLFDVATGNLLGTFANPSPGAGDGFGARVAALGTTQVIIGADQDDPGGVVDAGSVYLFDVATGNLLRTFNKAVTATGDRYGSWVAPLGANQILIGAPQGEIRPNFADGSFENDATGAGVVYLYDAGTGALVQTFQNPTPVTGDLFGWQVAAAGTSKVLIAAPGDESGATNQGAAYLFDVGTGNLLQTYTSSTSALYALSIATAGNDRLLIGSPGDQSGDGSQRGAVYLIDLTANEQLRIDAPRTQNLLGFGAAVVAPTPTKLFAGAPGDNTGAAQSGAAFYYDLPRAIPVLQVMQAGDRQLFGLDDEYRLYRLRDGIWTFSGGYGATIGVGNTGDSDPYNDVLYVRQFDNRLWTWTQTSWAYSGGYLPSVVASDGQCFGLGFDSQVWRYRIGLGWLPSGGYGVQIDVSGLGDADPNNDVVFLRSADNRVWAWNQAAWTFTGGYLPSFSAGDNGIFGLGSDGVLWRYSLGVGWWNLGGAGVQIALSNLGDNDGNNDLVFMRGTDNKVLLWSSQYGWVNTGGSLTTLVGGDGQAFGIGIDGLLWRVRIGAGWASHASNGGTIVDVGGDGNSYAFNDIVFQLAANGTVAVWDQVL